MFDFSWGHFLVVAVVALIVIGPKELPAVLRSIGQWTAKVRRMASEFQGQFNEALREAEMADLRKEIHNISDTARGLTSQLNAPVKIEETAKGESKPETAAETPETVPEIAQPADAVTPPASSPPADSVAAAAEESSSHALATPDAAVSEATAETGALAPSPEGSATKAG